MARYVDGFVIPIPKGQLKAYRAMALAGAKVWLKHGALEYRECVGDDLQTAMGVTFTKLTGAKPSETVLFSWITYKSRAHRDRVNKLVMKDPILSNMMTGKKMPFDPRRMAYGGFTMIVDAGKARS